MIIETVEAIEQKLIALVQANQIHQSDFVEVCLHLDAIKRACAGKQQVKTGEEVIAVLQKYQRQLEEQGERLEENLAGKLRYVSQESRDRWLYALDAKQTLMKAILEEVQR